jgi:predicted transcriptional regulator of viral defense system
MPTVSQKILSLGQARVFRAKDAIALGVPRMSLKRLVDSGKLWRADRGLYTATDALFSHQSLAEVAALHPSAVICLLSALRFHELTTENPSEVYIFVRKHSQRPKMEHQTLRVFWASGASFSEGIEEYTIAGVKVKITCPAKTVVDCFKFRNSIGVNVAAEALLDVWRNKKATADELWKYADVCRMTNVMRPYFEMMVAA